MVAEPRALIRAKWRGRQVFGAGLGFGLSFFLGFGLSFGLGHVHFEFRRCFLAALGASGSLMGSTFFVSTESLALA